MEESRNTEQNDSPSQEVTIPTDTKRKSLLISLFVAALSLIVFSAAIFLISDNQNVADVENSPVQNIKSDSENSSIQKNSQLPFDLEVHFPDTSRFNIKPDRESPSSFVVKDDRGLSLYNSSTERITSISLYDVVPNLKLGDYTKVEELLLFDTGEGVGVYNLVTNDVQIYNTRDGLADKSNIRFHPDPYDNNIVWIGTFRGLSQFDLADRTFQSYTREIGIPGTVWQPRVFHIDQNTVWVTVGANAYNTGGVARFDKTTEAWTAWGIETFVAEGEVNNRVDPVYVSVGSDNSIIIEEDNTEYIFDRKLQTWSVLRSFERGEPTAHGLDLSDDWFYFRKQQALHGYNVVTKENIVIDVTEIFNSTADTDLRTVDIRYDEVYNRYLLRPSSKVFVKHPYVVTFRVVGSVTEDVQLLTFSNIFDRYQYTDVDILDVEGDDMVMETQDSVVLYDVHQERSTFTLNKTDLLSGGFDIKAKLYPKVIAIHVAKYCEGMCALNDLGYQATTTAWNRETGQLELTAPFSSSTSGWRMAWEEDSFGVTLHRPNSEEPQLFNLNRTNRAYQKIIQHAELNEQHVDYDEFIPIESSNVVQYIKRGTKAHHNILKVKTIRPNSIEENHRIILPVLVNAFGVNRGYNVLDAVLHEDTAWLLTDRGLVKFNHETKEWKIYSSDDGLTQDAGNQLYISKDLFIIDNSLGITFYQYTDN